MSKNKSTSIQDDESTTPREIIPPVSAPQMMYSSFLLRMWRDPSPAGWRASLQSTRTGERHTFADLDSLMTFLLSQTFDE